MLGVDPRRFANPLAPGVNRYYEPPSPGSATSTTEPPGRKLFTANFTNVRGDLIGKVWVWARSSSEVYDAARDGRWGERIAEAPEAKVGPATRTVRKRTGDYPFWRDLAAKGLAPTEPEVL